jgi:hypothetical protein
MRSGDTGIAALQIDPTEVPSQDGVAWLFAHRLNQKMRRLGVPAMLNELLSASDRLLSGGRRRFAAPGQAYEESAGANDTCPNGSWAKNQRA